MAFEHVFSLNLNISLFSTLIRGASGFFSIKYDIEK